MESNLLVLTTLMTFASSSELVDDRQVKCVHKVTVGPLEIDLIPFAVTNRDQKYRNQSSMRHDVTYQSSQTFVSVLQWGVFF